MKTKFGRYLIKFMLVVYLLVLVSCTRVSQQNYDKIQPGMSMQDVVKILGEPTAVESVDFAGISGASATWKNHQAVISIQFLNNIVTIKSFNKTESSGNEENPNPQSP